MDTRTSAKKKGKKLIEFSPNSKDAVCINRLLQSKKTMREIWGMVFLWHSCVAPESWFFRGISDNFYNFFSSYAHPTSAGHLQTSQADYETSKAIMNAMLTPLFICSALYLHNYWILFQEILSGVNEEDRVFVTSWCDLGSKL